MGREIRSVTRGPLELMIKTGSAHRRLGQSDDEAPGSFDPHAGAACGVCQSKTGFFFPFLLLFFIPIHLTEEINDSLSGEWIPAHIKIHIERHT